MIQQLPNLLDCDAIRGLRLLAALHNAQRVKDVPAAWLLRLEEWVLRRFEAWTMTAEKVRCRLDQVAFIYDEVNRLKNFDTSSK